LKSAKEKCQVTYKDKLTRITVDFSTETKRRTLNDVFQALNKNNCKLRLFYLSKLFFIFEEEIKIFHDKQKLK
jgi:hypothetical protein